MKNLNIKIDDDRHSDLYDLKNYYSKKNGVKLSLSQTLKIVIFEKKQEITKENQKK